ncbi:hypothetical protein [Ligilactobacillus murinus]|nr:hypothetical protein [Ligilactobacillus murinus]
MQLTITSVKNNASLSPWLLAKITKRPIPHVTKKLTKDPIAPQ